MLQVTVGRANHLTMDKDLTRVERIRFRPMFLSGGSCLHVHFFRQKALKASWAKPLCVGKSGTPGYVLLWYEGLPTT